MRTNTKKPKKSSDQEKITCPSCGGSGQSSTFKGVSRFLLSIEECPECAGIGYVLQQEDSPATEQDKP